MLSRLLLIYAVVELAVIFTLVSTIGWGWTLLALLAAFVLGWGILAPVASSHLVRRIGQLRSGLTDPRSAAGDGALMTLSAVLVLIPGLVSSALGLLLLVPPVRSVARPRLTSFAVNRLQRRGLSYSTAYPTDSYVRTGGSHGDYIDGEVIDVHDVRPPASTEPHIERLNGR